MLTEIVEVTAVNVDTLIVKLTKHGACNCCKTPFLCSNTGPRELTIKNNAAFPILTGDKLEVGMEEKFTVVASLLAFGIPTIIMLVILISLQKSGALTSFLVAIITIFVYYLLMRKLLKNNKCFEVTVLKKI